MSVLVTSAQVAGEDADTHDDYYDDDGGGEVDAGDGVTVVVFRW